MQSKNPYVRALEIPEMLINSQPINFELSNLAFIRDIKTCNLKLTEKLSRLFFNKLLRKPYIRPSKEELGKTWRNLSRVGAMISNYNTILHQIEKRNKIDDIARGKVLAHIEVTPPNTEEDLATAFLESLGKKQTLNIIDLTELTVSLIDHVILEMNSFITEFPDIAESNIELAKVEMKRRLIKVHNDRPLYIKCLTPILKPNFSDLAKIFGQSHEVVEHRYTYSQWF